MSDLPSREDLKEWSTWDLGNIEACLLALVERCLPVVEDRANEYDVYESYGDIYWSCSRCSETGCYSGELADAPHTCPATQASDILREVERER